MARFLLMVLGLSVLAAGGPMAQASTPEAPWNSAAPYGMNTTFGWVAMEPRIVHRGEALDLTVPLLLRSDLFTDQATWLLFAFDLHSDALKVEFSALASNGTALMVHSDERAVDSQQPRLIVAGRDAPRDTVIELFARIHGADPGEHHLGVMAIAFDSTWKRLETVAGDSAQLYGFSRVRSAVVPGEGPPVHGLGNTISVLLVPVLLSGGVFLVGLSATVARVIVVRRRSTAPDPVRTG